MGDDIVEIFSLSIPETTDPSDDSSSSDDSDVEVTSTIDEAENELVLLGNDLCLNSFDSTDDDMDLQGNSETQSYPKVRTSEDNENIGVNLIVDNSSSTVCSPHTEASATPSQKRKRRTWSVKEKLEAIENYDSSQSKHSTAKAYGCTRHQLTQWLKTQDELKNLRSSKNGKLLVHKKSIISNKVS